MRYSSTTCLVLALLLLLAPACGNRSVGLIDGGTDSVIPLDHGAPDKGATEMGAPVDGPSSALSLKEKITRACTMAISCSPASAVDPISASSCIDELGKLDWPRAGYYTFGPSMQLGQRLLTCGQQPNCGAFHQCFGGSWIGFHPCRVGATCSGSKLVQSGSSGNYFDCASLGGTCQSLATNVPRSCCTHNLPCPSSPLGGVSCQGTKGIYCMMSSDTSHGVGIDFDCAPTNRGCSTTLGSFSVCVGTGATCGGDGSSGKTICAGSSATYCAEGKLATYDCSKNILRSACDPDDPLIPCRPAGKQCGSPPSKLSDQCQGDKLIVCVNGYHVAVDCTSLGFDTCDQSWNGKPARCKR
jgi:hypothetical protein